MHDEKIKINKIEVKMFCLKWIIERRKKNQNESENETDKEKIEFNKRMALSIAISDWA